MTPKEKAMELVDKFYQSTPNESWINQPIGLKKEYKAWEQAKQCGLIAVDEIIKQESTYDPSISDILFWKLVKEEINQINN
jgi:hypothetical protein